MDEARIRKIIEFIKENNGGATSLQISDYLNIQKRDASQLMSKLSNQWRVLEIKYVSGKTRTYGLRDVL